MTKIPLLPVLILVFIPASARAQQGPAYTVSELAHRALERGLEVEGAQVAVESASAAHKAVRTLYAPRLMIEGQALYFSENPTAEFEFNTGEVDDALQPIVDQLMPSGPMDVGEQHNLELTVTLAQPISQLGAIRELDTIRRLDVEIAESEVDAARVKLAHETREAAYQLLTARANIELLDETESELEARHEQVKAFHRDGQVGRHEVLAVGVARAKLRQSFIKARAYESVIAERLVTLARLDDERVVNVSPPPAELLPTVPPIDECLDRASQERPELQQLRHKRLQAEAGVRVKVHSFLPELSLVGSYQTQAGSTFDPPAFAAGAVLSWTPVDWGQKAYELRGARADRRRADIALEHVDELLSLDVRQAYAAAVSSRESVTVATIEREQADELLRVERLRFEVHESTATDLLAAETALLRARSGEHTTLYNYLIALSDLDRATGIWR